MNLAAIFPHFPQVAPPRILRKKHQSVTVAPPEQRTMSRNTLLTLENRPLRLHILRGSVWITRDGCPADIVVSCGAVFEQQPGAPVLVQALEDAEIFIASGAGASFRP